MVRARQIGQDPQTNVLYEILKQLEKLTKVTSKLCDCFNNTTTTTTEAPL